MSFLKFSRICLAISGVLVLGSLYLLINPGPRLSIEFTGGTLMEITAPEGKTQDDVQKSVLEFAYQEKTIENVNVATVRSVARESFVLRLPALSNEEHQALVDHLKTNIGAFEELRFNTIGPSVSASLRKNSLIALAVASIALICYLAFSFRGLPKQLSSWKFGTLAVVAFVHDVILTSGIFVIISRYTSFEVDTLFVTALLTILAYSANDTIVIFDRVRSSIQNDPRADVATAVVRGLKDCITRTTHTTITALIMLTSIFLLGSESIRWFILALIVGTIIGTYSSYFIAAPLLAFWSKSKRK